MPEVIPSAFATYASLPIIVLQLLPLPYQKKWQDTAVLFSTVNW